MTMKTLEYKIQGSINSIDNLITGKYNRGKSFDQRYSQINTQLELIYSNREESKYLDEDQLNKINNQIIQIKQRQQTYLGQKTKYNKELSDKVETVIEKLQTIRNEHYSNGNATNNNNKNYFTSLEKITKGKIKGSRRFSQRFNLLEEKLNNYEQARPNLNDVDEFKNILATINNNKYLNKKINFIQDLKRKGTLEEYANSLSELKRKQFKKDIQIIKQKERIEKKINTYETNIYQMIKPLLISKRITPNKTLDEMILTYKENVIKPTPIKINLSKEYLDHTITFEPVNTKKKKEFLPLKEIFRTMYTYTIQPLLSAFASLL